ncbi:hypothetical protein FOA52_002352 [Chlamydomonas sp. UWO 241]|nr:hypothetical protein FOA52_002352 [Chlamydomonas sp. UWO 241]
MDVVEALTPTGAPTDAGEPPAMVASTTAVAAPAGGPPAAPGYQSFGSFFTEVHVEELVRQAARPDYQPPAAPFPTSDLLAGIGPDSPLGAPARALFMIDFDAWTFVNAGAFGGVCVPAYREAERWRAHCERQPLTFLDSPTEATSDEEAGDFYLRVAALADKANYKRDLLIVAGGSQRRAWDSSQLRRPAVCREFNLQLSDRFGLLEDVPPEGADAQAEYDAMTAAIHEVAANHFAPRGSRRRRGWQFTLSQRTLRLMDARQRAHSAWLRSKSAADKRERNRANRAADAAVQRDRERWIGQQVAEAQDMLRKKNLRQFARACERLAGRSRSHQTPPAMRDVSGALHSGPDGVLKAMTESFDKLYGRETKLSDDTLNQLENDVAAFELTRATEVDEAHGRPPDLAETEACASVALGRRSGRQLFPHVVRVMRELGDVVGASLADLVLVPNATTGLNVAIQAAGLRPGDALYMLDIGYGSVKKMALAAAASVAAESVADPGGVGGLEIVVGRVALPASTPDEMVALVAATMPAHTRLAVFDAVTSNTALALPIEALVALCKERGVPVLIDAAHAPGQLPVNISSLSPDFYVANCHKWLAGPRGSAFLWVAPAQQARVRPLVVSHGSGCGFVSDFIWDGCRDYAPYLGLSSALRMWDALGRARCRAYCSALLADALAALSAAWGGGARTLAPPAMCGPSMACVRLPDACGAPAAAAGAGAGGGSGAPLLTSADAKAVQDLLHHHHRVECPIKCIQGALYARISVQIYNELADYERLSDAVLDITRGAAALDITQRAAPPVE